MKPSGQGEDAIIRSARSDELHAKWLVVLEKASGDTDRREAEIITEESVVGRHGELALGARFVDRRSARSERR